MSEEIRQLLIQEIRKRLVPLEAAPGDLENALLTAVTLRGSAGLTGETNLASALARIEPRLRAGDVAATHAIISLLRRALGRLEDGDTATPGSWPVPPPDLAPTAIEPYVLVTYQAELKDRLAGLDQCLAALDDPLEAARIAFRHVHTLKGASSAVGDQPMSWFCHGLEERLRDVADVPSARAALLELGQYRSILGGLRDDPLTTLRGLRGEIELSARLSNPPPPPRAPSIHDQGANEDTGRITSQSVAEILGSIDALCAMREKLDATSRRVRELGRRARSGTVGATLAEDLEGLAGELRAEGDELGEALLATKRRVSSLLSTVSKAETAAPVLAALTDADVPDVAAIMLENSSRTDTRDVGTRRAAAITRLKEELGRPFARVRTARVDGELVGFLLTWQVVDEVHVLDIATALTARRRGVGRALMTELIAFARTQPVRHLLLEVRRSNDPAIRLYRSLGFFATNVRKRYYDDGEDGVEMRLVFDETTRDIVPTPDEFPL